MLSERTEYEGGVLMRDLNKNGRVDPYEDPRCSIEERVEDLLAQMTLEEKVGQLVQVAVQESNDSDLRARIGQGRVGSIFAIAEAHRVNQYQRLAAEDS